MGERGGKVEEKCKTYLTKAWLAKHITEIKSQKMILNKHRKADQKHLTLFDSHGQKKITQTYYNQCIVPSVQPNHSKQCQACSQGRSD